MYSFSQTLHQLPLSASSRHVLPPMLPDLGSATPDSGQLSRLFDALTAMLDDREQMHRLFAGLSAMLVALPAPGVAQ